MNNVTEVDATTFERDVLQRSNEVPVVVDFWAEWCAPCRSLGPVLERLAEAAEGAWTLAKVDVDGDPDLASAFGVQGIPAVRAFKNGRQVAEFTGALPEPQVRAWLAGLGPSAADIGFEDGVRMEKEGDLEGAAAAYRKTLDLEPGHGAARAALAGVELRLRSGGLDEPGLRARAEADPLDVIAAMALADLETVEGRAEAAFARLLEVVRRAPAEDAEAARRRLVALMEVIPADDPRVAAARRALSRALF